MATLFLAATRIGKIICYVVGRVTVSPPPYDESAGSAIMAKFLFIFRESTVSRPQPSQEEMQALQAAWYKWMQKFSSAIVGGDGLKPSGRLVKAGVVTDGPYTE